MAEKPAFSLVAGGRQATVEVQPAQPGQLSHPFIPNTRYTYSNVCHSESSPLSIIWKGAGSSVVSEVFLELSLSSDVGGQVPRPR